MDYSNQKNNYKNNLLKWILLYAAIGLVAYALIYYFFFSNGGGWRDNLQPTQNNTNEEMAPINDGQDLMSASQSLDATDINQIDNELNQNDDDAKSL